MPKKAKWLIIGLIILLVLVLGFDFGYFGLYKPYRDAMSTMPEDGTMMLVRDAEGNLTLSWPQGSHHDRYLVQFLRDGDVVHEVWTTEEQIDVPQLPQIKPITIRVQSARGYYTRFSKTEKLRMGTGQLSAEVVLQEPTISDLAVSGDAQASAVTFTYTLSTQSQCRMYYLDASGNLTLLDTLRQNQVTLSLGGDNSLSIPDTGEELTFVFEAYRSTPGLVYYGTSSQQITVSREDLLPTTITLECTNLGDQTFRFTWTESKGSYYEIQRYQEETDTWETVHRVEADEERVYTTDTLPRYDKYYYRVVAGGGQAMEGSEYAATSDTQTVTTGASIKYCTIWPIQTLDVYKDAAKTQRIGTVPAVKAFCVLALEEGMFRIRFEDGYGYIDSNRCLINLPELLGDLCLYNITNSSQSLFMAHEYEIPDVTGTVVVGYENVQLFSGQQLVPLLYPAAMRLEQAAFAAIEQGYKLKIYDAYRPREATIALYDQAIDLKDQLIPKKTYTGKVLDDLPASAGTTLTYGELMTDFGRYTMNYFLAAGKSNHNKGIALDLTLVDSNNVELQMQTSMHDLSWYSELKRNNYNAKLLASIMQSVGFTGLASEWWHFNDLETSNTYVPPYQMEGVSAECWIADDQGWKYRRADGSYYVLCSAQIDGDWYTFDRYGYLVS